MLSRRNSQALSKLPPARLSEGDKGIIRMKGSRFVYEMTSESRKGAICKKKLLVPEKGGVTGARLLWSRSSVQVEASKNCTTLSTNCSFFSTQGKCPHSSNT